MMVEIAAEAKQHYLLNANDMPDTLLRVLYALSHLILLAIPCDRLCYHHSLDEETNS